MNADQLKGKWMQFKGELKQKYGKFTDDDLQQIEGNYDKFVGKVQERYGDKKEELMKWAARPYHRKCSWIMTVWLPPPSNTSLDARSPPPWSNALNRYADESRCSSAPARALQPLLPIQDLRNRDYSPPFTLPRAPFSVRVQIRFKVPVPLHSSNSPTSNIEPRTQNRT